MHLLQKQAPAGPMYMDTVEAIHCGQQLPGNNFDQIILCLKISCWEFFVCSVKPFHP